MAGVVLHGDPLEGQQEVKSRKIERVPKNIQKLPGILGGKKVPSDGQTELGERISRDLTVLLKTKIDEESLNG